VWGLLLACGRLAAPRGSPTGAGVNHAVTPQNINNNRHIYNQFAAVAAAAQAPKTNNILV